MPKRKLLVKVPEAHVAKVMNKSFQRRYARLRAKTRTEPAWRA